MKELSNPRVEMLRKMLYQIADEHGGNLLHPRVVQASQVLDTEIAKLMKNRPLHSSYYAAV